MTKTRRFRRKSSGRRDDEASSPPPIRSAIIPTAAAGIEPPGGYVAADTLFVTQPPKPNKGLTGKISTLFRRESTSRERGDGKQRTTKTSRTRSSDAVLDSSTSVPGAENSYTSRGEDDIDIEEDIDDIDDDDDDDGQMSRVSSTSKRIFYSSHDDDESLDDDDDSYQSRTSHVRGSGSSGVTMDESASVAASSNDTGAVKMIRRYRGFSTSIKSLFLDESLVCGAVGCFGLILSSRTEYLLQLRNDRRGALSPRSFRATADSKKMPSRIVAGGLLLTLLLMFSTFIIWGFGTGNGVAGDYLSGYDYKNNDGSNKNTNDDGISSYWDDYLSSNEQNRNNYYNGQNNNDDGGQQDGNDDGNQNDDKDANDDAEQQNDDAVQNDDAANNRQRRNRRQREQQDCVQVAHPRHGIFKLRDYHETLWEPILQRLQFDWYQNGEFSEKKVLVAASTGNRQRRGEEEEDDEDDATDDIYDEDGSYMGYRKRRDIASDIRIALLFVFLLFLGILGRRRRMRTRFYLVRARAQEDHLYYASSDEAAARRVAFDDTREDQYEGACSHTLCGCYPIDEVDALGDSENVEVADTGIFRRKKRRHHEDVVSRMFNCFMACCCGVVFKCWFQCLSICALAQEAREIRLLIPPRYQRIDFITHQPFHEYQHAVNDLRRGWLGKARRMSGILPHYYALSRLSRYILVVSILAVTTIVATLLFNPRAAFSWQDAVVLAATFVQAFLVLFVVHWIFHKSDLSLDAVIKMFAAGFLIAVPTAFFFEGLLVNLVLFSTWILYDLFVVMIGDGFSSWVFNHWRAIWIFGELFNAYIVAAVTEELCKYYTFRAVEHPDLVFLTGLQREDQSDVADGGIVVYPFSSLQVQKLARERSDVSQCSNRSHRTDRSRSRSRSRSRVRKSDRLIEETGTTETEFDEDELDARTRRQKAMAITTGMISVAVGLACAENFLYVFVLGGAVGENDPKETHADVVWEAWVVLFFRSIFPVHALAAAMQSINMIRKFVELDNHNGHRVGVGRIVLPAVIVHGSFDAVLMGINVYVETAWDRYLEENEGNISDEDPYNAVVVNVVAWVGITAVMIAGLLWYYRENRMQRDRLKVLEEQDKALQAQWAGVDSTGGQLA